MFSCFIVGLYCIDAIGAEVQGGTVDSDRPSIVCSDLRPQSEQQGGVVPGPISGVKPSDPRCEPVVTDSPVSGSASPAGSSAGPHGDIPDSVGAET